MYPFLWLNNIPSWLHHLLFISLSVDGYLDYLHFCLLWINAAVNVLCTTFCVNKCFNSFWYVGGELLGHMFNSVFNFLRNWVVFCWFLRILHILHQFSCSVMSDSLWPRGLQHARLPCSSLSPRACLNSCPLSQWCHPTISSFVTLFSSCLQSFPASGVFPVSWFFTSGGQSIGASASVLPMNIQDWCPLGLTGLISFQSKGLSRVFSNTTAQEHQFFGTQPSLWSTLTSVHECWKNHSFDYTDLCWQNNVSSF